MKIALVGCGKIADGHVEQIARMPHLGKLVAVCDAEPLMAEQLAIRYGIAAKYCDFALMLAREKPDVVHVCTPPCAHRRLAAAAIDAGCHVYVEKPLTESRQDDLALLRHAAEAGKKLTVGYTYLFDPPAQAVRALVAAGAIGEPVHVESVYGYDLGSAYGLAMLRDRQHWLHRLGGGLIRNNVDHLLNKLPEFVDGQPVVTAQSWRRAKTRSADERDAMDDELRVSVQGGRVTGHGLLSCHARPAMHRLVVYGTRDTVSADFAARTVTLAGGRRLPSALGRLWPAFEQSAQFFREGARNLVSFARGQGGYFVGLGELIRRFYESIANGTDPPIAYRDILWVSDAIDQIGRQRFAADREREAAE